MFYFTFAILVFSTPSLLTVYGLKLRLLHSFIIYSFIITISFILVLILPYHTAMYSIPALASTFSQINGHLTFCVNRLSKTIAILSVIGLMIRLVFFLGFVLLLMSDRFIRTVLGTFVGRHATGSKLSICGTMNPILELSIEKQNAFKHEKLNHNYSPSLAYKLASASRLSYEDINVIKYELEKSGFDVQNTFKPIAYKNICAFIVEKQDAILLVFRGTNPLNIQNYLTNMTIKRTSVYSKTGLMGKVHRGYWKAMGDPKSINSKKKNRPLPKRNRQNSFYNSSSSYKALFSIMQSIIDVLLFALTTVFQHILEPVDSSWINSSNNSNNSNIRSESLYTQAEEYILQLIQNNPKRRAKKKLYISGHSLGGAMGTIFLAKMIQCSSPLLDHFAGLYTFGQPKIGDTQFSKSFGYNISSKIFQHIYNNDIVPRISFFSKYDTPPGNIVLIKPGQKLTFYPSDDIPKTITSPLAISFIRSGLFDRFVLQQLIHENKIRILFRILFPCFLNDHFPSDYCKGLRCIVQG